jgi:predicted DCC family thiol-disulfide oxidoreductase YuxK
MAPQIEPRAMTLEQLDVWANSLKTCHTTNSGLLTAQATIELCRQVNEASTLIVDAIDSLARAVRDYNYRPILHSSSTGSPGSLSQ